jgi:hypothetical protein
MARQMKTVHARKTDDMTIRLEAPKCRFRNAPPSVSHKDKRRRNRGSERIRFRKEQGD